MLPLVDEPPKPVLPLLPVDVPGLEVDVPTELLPVDCELPDPVVESPVELGMTENESSFDVDDVPPVDVVDPVDPPLATLDVSPALLPVELPDPPIADPC